MTKKEKRERYAAYIMERNARVTSLSEKQHKTLAWLCKIRHEIHCDVKAFFYTECDNYNKFLEYIDNESSSGIRGRIKEVGLPDFNWSFCIDIDDLNYELHYAGKKESIRLVETINSDIEKYLTAIDEKYGTYYCPSGFARNPKRKMKVKRKMRNRSQKK